MSNLVPGLEPWNEINGGSCLLPPASHVEAGASGAVCSEAGASEQDVGESEPCQTLINSHAAMWLAC